MAVELIVEEGRWSPRKLRGFLEDWLARAPVRVLGGIPWQVSRQGAWTWIFPEGGIRGCSLRLEASLVKAGVLHVRLGILASRADWMLAHGLVRGLLKAGGGRALGPDGRVLRPEDLSDSAVAGEALARMRADAAEIVRALERGEPFAALPNPPFSLVLTKRQLPAEREPARLAIALEEYLRDMAARYQAAEVAPVVALPDGSSLCVWSRDDALLDFSGHLGVQHGATSEDGVVLPAARGLELLGARLEVVSERRDRFYVPALRAGEPADDALLGTLIQAGQPLSAFMERFRAREERLF